MTEEIRIIPSSSIEEDLLSEVEKWVRQTFGDAVTIDKGVLQSCGEAYDPERKQYSAQEFLDHAGIQAEDGMRVLCITDVDLYVPGLNYIFGLADEFRPVALVSTARFKNGNGRATERTVKTAIHELGHTYGLQHCNDHRCVMFFSYTLSDTDYKGKHFCAHCRKALEKKLHTIKGEI
ncbi:MAG: archaemetzincin family Zn-dependent metalloprotease [Nitrospirae bacterium]|nr:archaemetzincin family Zn-dependent metalloprotease [Nitrospirota bacterium]MCL5238430.1 archaemetzincin family Zn-dependent metalloprotease [Nitrospirota bacterium]